ncbi:hypothetical protein AVEN_137507-1 [Araneus ventricosus]|uniref:Uncharacterized protein n=1 Tax=Araneus ventricosus TaxID=182803 RepID=A0A4Y2G4J9_ARAVE|nr:hypothetical protein AVEN_137507-1 [Araneus ventricosus]
MFLLGHGYAHDYHGRFGNGIILPHTTFGVAYEKNTESPQARSNEPFFHVKTKDLAYFENVARNVLKSINEPIPRASEGQIPGLSLTSVAKSS